MKLGFPNSKCHALNHWTSLSVLEACRTWYLHSGSHTNTGRCKPAPYSSVEAGRVLDGVNVDSILIYYQATVKMLFCLALGFIV